MYKGPNPIKSKWFYLNFNLMHRSHFCQKCIADVFVLFLMLKGKHCGRKSVCPSHEKTFKILVNLSASLFGGDG